MKLTESDVKFLLFVIAGILVVRMIGPRGIAKIGEAALWK